MFIYLICILNQFYMASTFVCDFTGIISLLCLYYSTETVLWIHALRYLNWNIMVYVSYQWEIQGGFFLFPHVISPLLSAYLWFIFPFTAVLLCQSFLAVSLLPTHILLFTILNPVGWYSECLLIFFESYLDLKSILLKSELDWNRLSCNFTDCIYNLNEM